MYNAGALSQTYTWGKDLSGSMQGAGGVGGLLEVSFNSNSYYPTYDGNGNVSEYLDSSGSVVAHFEYDAFGKTVVENGTLAGNFFHRFSTKQWNPLAELYYYGYRFYAPETGRWISRDPMEESGGLNIYIYVGNDGINKIDYLGLSWFDCTSYIEDDSEYSWDLGNEDAPLVPANFKLVMDFDLGDFHKSLEKVDGFKDLIVDAFAKLGGAGNMTFKLFVMGF